MYTIDSIDPQRINEIVVKLPSYIRYEHNTKGDLYFVSNIDPTLLTSDAHKLYTTIRVPDTIFYWFFALAFYIEKDGVSNLSDADKDLVDFVKSELDKFWIEYKPKYIELINSGTLNLRDEYDQLTKDINLVYSKKHDLNNKIKQESLDRFNEESAMLREQLRRLKESIDIDVKEKYEYDLNEVSNDIDSLESKKRIIVSQQNKKEDS